METINVLATVEHIGELLRDGRYDEAKASTDTLEQELLDEVYREAGEERQSYRLGTANPG